MINAKLDSKYVDFIAETKNKILDLGKELDCLNTENGYLEDQVTLIFHTNSDLQSQSKALELQLQRFKEIHSLTTNEQRILKGKVEKAKSDYENLSIARKKQSDLIWSEANSYEEKEKILRFNRQAREELFQSDMERANYRLLELNKEHELREELNLALLTEINNSENIEASIISSIQSEMLSISAITGKSFFKSRINK